MSKSNTVLSKISAKRVPQVSRIPPPVTREFNPIQIKIESHDDYSMNKAVALFKKLVQRERIIGQVKERREYEKPSEKKRRKRREARDRRLADERRERLIASGEWDRVQRNRNQDYDDDIE